MALYARLARDDVLSRTLFLQKDLASPRAGRQYEAPTIAVGFTLDGIIGRMKSFLEEVHERFRVMENPVRGVDGGFGHDP